MPPRRTFTPAELMAIKLEASADVARLIALAAECGPHGLDLLCHRLRALAAGKSTIQGRPTGVEAGTAVTSGIH